jgi:O-acetyl-ADP-ribose deacetylase (regulator of RNase III)
MAEIHVVQSDTTMQRVDTVVNAANESLLLDGATRRAYAGLGVGCGGG